MNDQERRFNYRAWQAVKSKTGQAALREAIQAMDAMPKKRLVAVELASSGGGDVCLLDLITQTIPNELVCKLREVNDFDAKETPEARWAGVRAWLTNHLTTAAV